MCSLYPPGNQTWQLESHYEMEGLIGKSPMNSVASTAKFDYRRVLRRKWQKLLVYHHLVGRTHYVDYRYHFRADVNGGPTMDGIRTIVKHLTKLRIFTSEQFNSTEFGSCSRWSQSMRHPKESTANPQPDVTTFWCFQHVSTSSLLHCQS